MAASLVFQLASVKPVAMFSGIKEAASTSASSGVYLYLKVSNAPGAAGGGGLADFVVTAALAGNGFFTGAVTGAEASAGEPAGEAGFFA